MSAPLRGLFVSGTGTGVGKTFVTCALARSLVDAGLRTIALKPVETGVADIPEDAVALAAACGVPVLAYAEGFHRVAPALSPYAAGLEGAPIPPAPKALAETIRGLAKVHRAAVTLVEGAGGLLVPLDGAHTMADLAEALDVPVLLVALDALGTLSHTLTAFESAQRRGLRVLAVYLSHPPAVPPDGTAGTNARILRERLDVPVIDSVAALHGLICP